MRLIPILGLTMTTLAAAPLVAQQPAGAGSPVGRGDSAGSATRVKLPEDGAGLYRTICQACHMADAKGGTGAATIPALAANPRLVSAQYAIMMVAQGRGAMPGFVDLMTPAQISAVVRYVCTNFGNSCKGDASSEAVRQIAAHVQHRPG